MERAIRPISVERLARWIFTDLDRGETVLGIPVANLAVPDRRLAFAPFGRPIAAPLGVAAGPHAALAQSMVAAWLCGARVFELATLRGPESRGPRPTLVSTDLVADLDGANPLTPDDSVLECVKAWVLMHALAQRLGLPGPGAHFVMSVSCNPSGTPDLESERFVRGMTGAREAIAAAVKAVAQFAPQVRELDIPESVSDHVVLAIPRGCPPHAVEQLALHLLRKTRVHTWLKLNPTLLGPERIRSILNERLGYEDIVVPDSAFAQNLFYEDALDVIDEVAAGAAGERHFGLKVAAALEVVDERTAAPTGARRTFLSGRAVFPLALSLAHQLSESLAGSVPVSFCGGADAESFADLVADGLGPVTTCTDLFKPGGYARLQQYVVNLERAMAVQEADNLESFVAAIAEPAGGGARGNLARHLSRTFDDPRYAAHERPAATKSRRPLKSFDCIAAPCQEACPGHEPVADYLRAVACGDTSLALANIFCSNALPSTTSSICDHPCTEGCVRNHYDAPVAIRELKRFAVENGVAPMRARSLPRPARAVVVGAGPAGLSTAYHLALGGVAVTVVEARTALGGLIESAIPRFRFSSDLLEQDLERVRRLGVEVHLGQKLGRDLDLDSLRRAYDFVFLGVGAQVGRRLGMHGEEATGVLDGLAFLERVRAAGAPEIGHRVLVIGGGNPAVDAARAARRIVGAHGSVDLVYRRDRAHMRAGSAEVAACLEEGVVLRDRLAPRRVVVREGHVAGLACARVQLGATDASGRPEPAPVVGGEILLPCDTIIVAIGQRPAFVFGEGAMPELEPDGHIRADPLTHETSLRDVFAGGDVLSGPASIARALGDGRAAAEEILRRCGGAPARATSTSTAKSPTELLERKARRTTPATVARIPASQRGGFEPVEPCFSPEAAAIEAARCLECDQLCSLCVTVCPNRANQAYRVEWRQFALPSLVVRGRAIEADGTKVYELAQSTQVVHIADLCSGCGNCTAYCPSAGQPHRDKPRVWLSEEEFVADPLDAVHWVEEPSGTAIEARLGGRSHRLSVKADEFEYRTDDLVVRLDRATLQLRGATSLAPFREGDRPSLDDCAFLIRLLSAQPALPIAASTAPGQPRQ